MPIYEYQCTNCGHEFETIQKISEDPLLTCPECQQDHLRKKVSAAGFRLKGGGWYETDFKKDGRKNVTGDGAKDGAKSDGGSDSAAGKSDTAASKSDGGASSTGSTAASKSDSKSSSSSSDSS